MSLRLDRSAGRPIASFHDDQGQPPEVEIRWNESPAGPVLLSLDLEDFLALARYVLANLDLRAADPRFDFVASVRALELVPGWRPGGIRFARKPHPPERVGA